MELLFQMSLKSDCINILPNIISNTRNNNEKIVSKTPNTIPGTMEAP